ncbi:pilus assembly protein PilM [bacterium]|nr:pilus assembly protein PilM [bacterium]
MALFGRRAATEGRDAQEEGAPRRQARQLRLKRRPGSVVGFDFQDNSIRVVQMSKRRRELVLERVAFIPVDGDMWRMGRIGDAEAFLDCLRTGLVDAGIGGKRAVIGLSGTNSVVRVVRLPKMKPAQLRETLNVQLGQYVPFPPEDTLFKYEIIGEVIEDEIEKYEILILATRYSIIEPILLAVQKLGMDPVGVKIGFLSTAGVLTRYYEDFSQSVAVVDLRNAITDILFVSGQSDDLLEEEETGRRKKKKQKVGTPARLARTIEFGYERVMRDLAKELEVDVAGLAEILRTTEIDLMDAGEAASPDEAPPEDPFAAFASDEVEGIEEEEEAEGVTSAQVNAILRRLFEEFVVELEKSRRYFESSSKRRERLGRIVLVGNLSRFANLEAYLTEASGLDVVLGDPLETIDYGSTEWYPEEMRGRVAEITTPVALAREAFFPRELGQFNLLPREFTVRRTSIATVKWVAVLGLVAGGYAFTVVRALTTDLAAANIEKEAVLQDQRRPRTWNMPVLESVCIELEGEWDGVLSDPPSVGDCTRSYSYSGDATRHDEEQGLLNAIRPKIGAVATLAAAQFPWAVLLDEIRTIIPKNVWLSQRAGDANNLVGIDVNGMEEVVLTGQALSEEDIFVFVQNLHASRFFTDTIVLDYTLAVGEEEAAQRRRFRPGGGRIDELKSYFDVEERTLLLYNFTINLPLNPDLQDQAELMAGLPPVLLPLFGAAGGARAPSGRDEVASGSMPEGEGGFIKLPPSSASDPLGGDE